MIQWSVPNDRDQLQFLKNIQRLLDEGSFVASYKFALLHALADLAMLEGDDSGAPLDLSAHQIAGQFIKLYWQQVRPFESSHGDSGVVLRQNSGRQADVVNQIINAHGRSAGSLYRLQKDHQAWGALVRSVARTVGVMPLWKLQTVGSERLDFLYDNKGRGGAIQLKPGVAYCFRAFYPVLCGLFRSAWIGYLRRVNTRELGYTVDLNEFLFGHERAALEVYKPILREVQERRCFYCDGALAAAADVDHFIPWSRCHSDLAHNFVLTHRGCNAAKSDHLAFERHLASWVRRNGEQGAELEQRFDAAALIHDLKASERIASWAYCYVESAQGQVWIEGTQFKHLDSAWREILAS
jgi:hypothetical protein